MLVWQFSCDFKHVQKKTFGLENGQAFKEIWKKGIIISTTCEFNHNSWLILSYTMTQGTYGEINEQGVCNTMCTNILTVVLMMCELAFCNFARNIVRVFQCRMKAIRLQYNSRYEAKCPVLFLIFMS